jgi:hypothetical protein
MSRSDVQEETSLKKARNQAFFDKNLTRVLGYADSKGVVLIA